MRTQSMRLFRLFTVIVGIVAIAQSAPGAFVPILIARTANVIPNTGGMTIGLHMASGVSKSGEVLLVTDVHDPNGPMDYVASVAWDAGALSLITREGMPAPGMPGITLTQAIMSISGETRALEGVRVGPGFNSTSRALWLAEGASPFSPVMAVGMPAPSLPGLTVNSWNGFSLGHGHNPIRAELVGQGDPVRALYDASPTSIRLLTREQTLAPAPLNDRNVLKIDRAATPAGSSDLIVQLETGSSQLGLRSLWRAQEGQMNLLMAYDSPIGNAGIRAGETVGWTANEHGDVAVYTRMHGTGVTSSNDDAICINDASGTRILAREGSVIPGTNIVFGAISNDPVVQPAINSNGTIAFGTPQGIVVGRENAFRRAVSLGDPAAGTDEVFTALYDFALDRAGDVVFEGATPSITHGLWAALPDGSIVSLIKNGDTLDIGNGNLRTVRAFALSTTSSETGELTNVGGDGLVSFDVTFTTTLRAVYMVQLPEPASATSLVIIAIGYVLPRRRVRLIAPTASVRHASTTGLC